MSYLDNLCQFTTAKLILKYANINVVWAPQANFNISSKKTFISSMVSKTLLSSLPSPHPNQEQRLKVWPE